jgi:hypothetical protein
LRIPFLVTCLLSAAFAPAAPVFAADLPEACASYTAAVTGGPLPPADSETVVTRWLGNANYEFACKGKVYATAIFVSHVHFDHVSDIGPVSRQTGAPYRVYAATLLGDYLDIRGQ